MSKTNQGDVKEASKRHRGHVKVMSMRSERDVKETSIMLPKDIYIYETKLSPKAHNRVTNESIKTNSQL